MYKTDGESTIRNTGINKTMELEKGSSYIIYIEYYGSWAGSYSASLTTTDELELIKSFTNITQGADDQIGVGPNVFIYKTTPEEDTTLKTTLKTSANDNTRAYGISITAFKAI